MELQRKIRQFTNLHQTTGWVIVLMGGGAALQLLIWLVTGILASITAGAEGTHNYYSDVMSYLVLPASGKELLFQPWTLFTYPFFYLNHFFSSGPEGLKYFDFPFLRLLFDGLIIWSFGRIHQQFMGEQRTRRMLILSIPTIGLLSVFLSMVFGPTDGTFMYLSGMTPFMILLVVSVATLVPNYPVELFLFGRVKIVWVAVVLFLLEVFVFSAVMTPQGVATLLAGVFGFSFVYFLRQGTDVIERVWDFYKDKQPSKPESRSKVKVSYSSQTTKEDREVETTSPNGPISQDIIDTILDKINDKGYESLSRKEKELLLRASSQDEDEKA